MLGQHKNFFVENQVRFFKELDAYIAHKSISTDPQWQSSCLQCAQWLQEHLTKLDFETKLLSTAGNPVVYATRQATAGAKTILIYGHYDVVDPGPSSDWSSDPFVPRVSDGRLYARGASDNKAPTFFILKALEALIANNSLNAGVTILVEGEEEVGSSSLVNCLPQWRDLLKADFLYVCDSGTMAQKHPALTLGLRNNIQAELKLSGLSSNLHSGAHGGMVKNPATELCRLLATLHSADGRIAVPGFYDGIIEPSDLERQLVNKSSISAEEYQGITGLLPTGGEQNYTMLERRGFRPSLDIGGLTSGYAGPGVMNIIPAQAEAKITARIVPNQSQDQVLYALEQHLRKHAPAEFKFELKTHKSAGEAFRLRPDSEAVKLARAAINRATAKDPMLLWEGGSIPVVSVLKDLTGAEPILLGMILAQDNMHGSNESFLIEHAQIIFNVTCELVGSL